MNILRKMWANKWILRSIFSSIYFNLYYLPLKQAVKLPILLYKPRFININMGEVKITSSNIRFGMIRLGFPQVCIYPNSGIIWDNRGICVFHGSCAIGNASAISIGKTGHVEFGNSFGASTAFRLISYYKVTFHDNVLLGWENIVTDTDFHKLTKLSGGNTKGYAPISIGKDNWFGMKCIILKGTHTPDYCTVGANSVLNKKYDYPKYSIIAGNPAKLKASGYWRDQNNNQIEYPSNGE